MGKYATSESIRTKIRRRSSAFPTWITAKPRYWRVSVPRNRIGYRHAIAEFVERYCSEPRLSFSKVVVTRFRIALEESWPRGGNDQAPRGLGRAQRKIMRRFGSESQSSDAVPARRHRSATPYRARERCPPVRAGRWPRPAWISSPPRRGARRRAGSPATLFPARGCRRASRSPPAGGALPAADHTTDSVHSLRGELVEVEREQLQMLRHSQGPTRFEQDHQR